MRFRKVRTTNAIATMSVANVKIHSRMPESERRQEIELTVGS